MDCGYCVLTGEGTGGEGILSRFLVQTIYLRHLWYISMASRRRVDRSTWNSEEHLFFILCFFLSAPEASLAFRSLRTTLLSNAIMFLNGP